MLDALSLYNKSPFSFHEGLEEQPPILLYMVKNFHTVFWHYLKFWWRGKGRLSQENLSVVVKTGFAAAHSSLWIKVITEDCSVPYALQNFARIEHWWRGLGAVVLSLSSASLSDLFCMVHQSPVKQLEQSFHRKKITADTLPLKLCVFSEGCIFRMHQAICWGDPSSSSCFVACITSSCYL